VTDPARKVGHNATIRILQGKGRANFVGKSGANAEVIATEHIRAKLDTFRPADQALELKCSTPQSPYSTNTTRAQAAESRNNLSRITAL
jgi:hypothetical protein